MVELKSVEHTAATAEAPDSGREAGRAARVTAGSRGSVPAGRSRDAALLGTGRSEHPLRRPRSALETVIDTDDRRRILETDLFPWRTICALHITSALGGFVGTGWLAGPRTVITAGHCVYHLADMGGWANEIEVTPGRNDLNTPFGTAVA